jgi:hypothetical protein
MGRFSLPPSLRPGGADYVDRPQGGEAGAKALGGALIEFFAIPEMTDAFRP